MLGPGLYPSSPGKSFRGLTFVLLKPIEPRRSPRPSSQKPTIEPLHDNLQEDTISLRCPTGKTMTFDL